MTDHASAPATTEVVARADSFFSEVAGMAANRTDERLIHYSPQLLPGPTARPTPIRPKIAPLLGVAAKATYDLLSAQPLWGDFQFAMQKCHASGFNLRCLEKPGCPQRNTI